MMGSMATRYTVGSTSGRRRTRAVISGIPSGAMSALANNFASAPAGALLAVRTMRAFMALSVLGLFFYPRHTGPPNRPIHRPLVVGALARGVSNGLSLEAGRCGCGAGRLGFQGRVDRPRGPGDGLLACCEGAVGGRDSHPRHGGGENLVRATCRFHRYLRLKREHARERRAPADWKVSGLLAWSMATVGKEEVFDQCRTRSR